MRKCILEYLEETVKRVPDKAAFTAEEGTLTFRQVYEQARAIGTKLLREGHCKRPVVVFMQKQPKTITAFLGVIYSGCFYIPLDADMPRCRMEEILRRVNPVACICDDTTFAAAKDLPGMGRLYRYDEIASGKTEEGALAAVRERQIDTDPVYIVFTSGSTGIPKGVVGSHRAVMDYIENLCQVLKFDEDTVFGNQTPLSVDACLKEILPTLKYGATTHLIPRKLFLLPVRLVAYLNENKINTICWVVSALTYISSFNTFDTIIPKSLHTIAFASEVFPVRQLNRWRRALPDARFFNLYGPTEATGICCYYQVDREFEEGEILPVGRPFGNTEILLLDENDRVPALGEQGEICIRGTRLTHGYFADPERTDAVFVQNPLNPDYPERIYRTGDMGRYNHRGELEFLCRKDNQIKLMGRRIELGEIEAAANACKETGSACCVFDDRSKKLTLYYVGALSEGELKNHIKQRLPGYMIPHRLCRLEVMPLTPNGKIDRNLLKQRSAENG